MAPSSELAECPEAYLCPITQACMTGPVMAPDGHTYERTAIQRWFRSNTTSPATNVRLNSTALLPNHLVKSQIAAWRDENREQGGPQAQQRQLKGLVSKVQWCSTSDEVVEAQRGVDASGEPAALGRATAG